MLVNGLWTQDWNPIQQKDDAGRFIRQDSAFNDRPDHQSIKQSNRFKLYVAYICPWATRTLIARSLLGLEDHIDVSVVEPQITDSGWKFGNYPGCTGVDEEASAFIHELYTRSNPSYTGRATVPVLWDRNTGRIINNESSQILRILNEDFRPLHQSPIDLYPKALHSEINAFNHRIYETLNNGVYRSGFASSQKAYDEAVIEVFATLDWLESHFKNTHFAAGNRLTESDIHLFATLSRFDVVYYGLFKTNIRQLSDYPALSRYLDDLLQIKDFAKNTRIDHIKAGYYSVKALNPFKITPKGPDLSWYKYLPEGI